MDKEALENWYDELYQMVLLAFLLLDNVERTGKVKELKGKIAEIFVDKRYAGKTVEEMEAAEQVTIFLILREDLSILPQKDTMLKLNDIIVIRGEHS